MNMKNQTIHLFIDANIFLRFYDFTNEYLEALSKLRDRISNGMLVLYVTQQICDEVWRNRERKLAQSLSRVTDAKIPNEYPNYANDEKILFDKVKSAEKELQEARENLIKDAESRIEKRKLKADTVLKDLFSEVHPIDIEESIIHRARLRVDLGNPPGKRVSIGDAVHWETLLERVPDGEDLILISDDSDFRSPLNDRKPLDFLEKEWMEKKQGHLFLFRNLLEFSENKIHLQLKMEKERERRQIRCIKRLENSATFANTHNAIRELSSYFPFSVDNIRRLVESLSDNSQIELIHEDQDVANFYRRLHQEHQQAMPQDLREVLYRYYPNLRPPTREPDVLESGYVPF